MITIIRTKTLAELRSAAASDRAIATLRARTLALEAASALTGDYPKPDRIPGMAREIGEWIGNPAAEAFEVRMVAVARLLADLASHRTHIYGTYEFTEAAEHYYRMLAEPTSDTRPAADLSTGQPQDGANHQHVSGDTNR